MLHRLLACMIAVSSLYEAAPAWAHVKCAIIAGKDAAGDLPALASLLEVRLSQDERVRLVERTELDRVLQEQQLFATGLVGRGNIIKVGQLLRADTFVLISTESAVAMPSAPGAGTSRSLMDRLPPDRLLASDVSAEPSAVQAPAGRLVRIRVVETARGLRLWETYEQLAQGDAQAVSTRIAGTILDVLRKVAAPPGEVVAIGIVDIHRVQLPEKYEPLARVLPGLLSARLGKELRIIMLEREDLAVLLREKQLTAGEESAFWSSGVLIDGYLQPGEKNPVAISLRLRKGSGETLSAVQVAADPNAISVAVDHAATAIVKAVLNASPVARRDLAREAAEFHRQGQLLARHGRHRTATSQFEAAHALQPQSVRYTAALFQHELPPVQGIVEPYTTNAPSYSPMELAELASLLVRQIDRAYEEGGVSAQDLIGTYAWILGGAALHSYFGNPVSVASEEVKLINNRNRRLWVELFDRAIEKEGIWQSDPSLVMRVRANLGGIWPGEPQERVAYLKKRINEAIMPPRLGGIVESADLRGVLCEQVLLQRALSVASMAQSGRSPEDTGEFVSLWNEYLTGLTRVDDPVVRLYALMARAHATGFSNSEAAETGELSSEAVDALQQVLRDSGNSITDVQKSRIYKHMGSCLALMLDNDPNGALRLLEKALMPLIEAEDAKGLALWFPCKILEPDPPPESMRLLQRVAEILQTERGNPEVAKAFALVEDRLKRMRPPAGAELRGPGSAHSSASIRSPMEKLRTGTKPILDMYFLQDRMHAEIRANLLLIARLSDTFRNRAEQQGTVDLAAIDVENFRLISMQSTHLAGQFRIAPRIQDIAVIGDTAYIALTEAGILRVGGVRKEGRRLADDYKVLAEADGLPSRLVIGLVEDGARLWISYGDSADESGLGVYDPATGRWEGILCSTRQGDPPFHAGLPYAIGNLTPVAPNRLFFHLSLFSRDREAMERIGDRYAGLWSIDTVTRELKYLQFWGEIVSHGERPLLRSSEWLAELDLEKKQVALLLGKIRWLDHLPDGTARSITAMMLREDPFVSSAVSQRLVFGVGVLGHIDLSTAVIHGDTIWAQSGTTQLVVIPRGATESQVVVRDNDLLDGEPVVEFLSTPHGLVAVGENTVGLVGRDGKTVTKLVDVAGFRPERRR